MSLSKRDSLRCVKQTGSNVLCVERIRKEIVISKASVAFLFRHVLQQFFVTTSCDFAGLLTPALFLFSPVANQTVDVFSTNTTDVFHFNIVLNGMVDAEVDSRCTV